MDAFEALLHEPPWSGPTELLPWWSAVAPRLAGRTTFDQALWGGLLADRLGLAFVAGYQAALARLVGPGAPGQVLAVAFTEEGGAHPRAIQASLRQTSAGWSLTGRKTWTTCGSVADELVVVASTGEAEGRNLLRALLLPTSAPGVTIEAMPETPFVPEIPHASVVFEEVAVSELLPGDGYLDTLKPFRTIEDIHIQAAVLGYLVRGGREAGWPPAVLEDLLVPALALVPLAPADPLSPTVHRALGGVLARVTGLLEELEPHWDRVDPEVVARWRRDRSLLGVAGRARARRLERARTL